MTEENLKKLLKFLTLERSYVAEEKRYLEAGGKLLSPSGDDITREKIAELTNRLDQVQNMAVMVQRAIGQ